MVIAPRVSIYQITSCSSLSLISYCSKYLPIEAWPKPFTGTRTCSVKRRRDTLSGAPRFYSRLVQICVCASPLVGLWSFPKLQFGRSRHRLAGTLPSIWPSALTPWTGRFVVTTMKLNWGKCSVEVQLCSYRPGAPAVVASGRNRLVEDRPRAVHRWGPHLVKD
jgi:hypothetical protein